MNAEVVIGVIGAILAIAGGLGVAYAVFRSATVQKTLDLYQSENEALGRAVARQQGDLLAFGERMRALEEENRVLRNVVTGKQYLEEFSAAFAKREREHQAVMALLAEIREQLAELWRGVVRVLGDQ